MLVEPGPQCLVPFQGSCLGMRNILWEGSPSQALPMASKPACHSLGLAQIQHGVLRVLVIHECVGELRRLDLGLVQGVGRDPE
jgi:hypothetical protein